MGVPQIIQVMRNHGSVFNTAMVTWEYMKYPMLGTQHMLWCFNVFHIPSRHGC